MPKELDKDQLDEFKASGEDSEVMEPVTPAGGEIKDRRADKRGVVKDKTELDKVKDGATKKGGDQIETVATTKAPPRRADKSMKEHAESLFEGEDLSEDFKTRAATIFEAAVLERIHEEKARLEEEFTTKLEEQVEIVTKDLTEKLDHYTDYLADKWLEDNRLEVEHQVRTEMTESFIAGLRQLFEDHAIDIPDSDIDVVQEMAAEIETLQAALEEQTNETIDLKLQLEQIESSAIVEEISEGLTDSQKDRLVSLAEDITYENLDELRDKLAVIKENFFGNTNKSKKTLTENVFDDEALDEDTTEKPVFSNPAMKAYAEAISRTKKTGVNFG